MARKEFGILTKISAALMMASASTRFVLTAFQNHRLKRRVRGGIKGIITHVDGGEKTVYVAHPDKHRYIAYETCADLFLPLTWLNISRRVMAVFSGLVIVCNIILGMLKAFSKE